MNTQQPTIVILGAGQIGRGFVADLFAAAGYRLVLVDQSAELVAALRAAGRYTVVCAENAERRHDHVVAGYEAYTVGQRDEVTAAVATADLLAVAVFPDAFGTVAQSLLPGLAQRRQERPDAALDILLCANLSHAAAHFRAALDAAPLAAGAAQVATSEEMQAYLDTRIGLVETLVMRMVADPPAAEREREPLLVWTNGLAQFPVDGRAFRGPLPDVPGLRPVNDMRAEETRKLYTYNMCHAALAYLGSLPATNSPWIAWPIPGCATRPRPRWTKSAAPCKPSTVSRPTRWRAGTQVSSPRRTTRPWATAWPATALTRGAS